MTDIVERLRSPLAPGLVHPNDRLRAEAADEIERLQAIERAAQRAYDYHCSGYGAHSEFNANKQLDLLNELGRALEGK